MSDNTAWRFDDEVPVELFDEYEQTLALTTSKPASSNPKHWWDELPDFEVLSWQQSVGPLKADFEC